MAIVLDGTANTVTPLNGALGATTPSTVVATNVNTPNTFGFKNRIINGAMQIDQRNAGASVTPTSGSYSLDRWQYGLSAASKFTAQQSSVAPAGFTNSLLITSSSAYSITSGDYFVARQPIEGLNVADLGWGTANAQTVTLSFWVRSSLTGTFGGAIYNNGADRSNPFTYTISAANTWEQKTVTIAGDTSGTWLTTNGTGLVVALGFGVGSTYLGTAGTWASTLYLSATGATGSLVGTSGATLYITGVQLEKGSTATSFDVRDYGRELIMCQRYLPAFISTSTVSPVCDAFSNSTTNVIGSYKFKVNTRVPPTGITATAGSTFAFSNTANYTASAITFGGASNDMSTFSLTVSGATSLTPGYIYCNSATGKILFTGCEL